MLTLNDMLLISCSIIVANFVLASIGTILHNMSMAQTIEISQEEYEEIKRRIEGRHNEK